MAAVKKSEVNPNNPRGIPSADFIVRVSVCVCVCVRACLCVSVCVGAAAFSVRFVSDAAVGCVVVRRRMWGRSWAMSSLPTR